MMNISNTAVPPFLQAWLSTQATSKEKTSEKTGVDEETQSTSATPAASRQQAGQLALQQARGDFLERLTEYQEQYNQLLQTGVTIDTAPAQNLLKKAVPVIMGTANSNATGQEETMLGATIKEESYYDADIITIISDDGHGIYFALDDIYDGSEGNSDIVNIDTTYANRGVVTLSVVEHSSKITLVDDDGSPTIAEDGTITIVDGSIYVTISPNGLVAVGDVNSNNPLCYITGTGHAVSPDSNGQFPPNITIEYYYSSIDSVTICDNSGNYITLDPDDITSYSDQGDTVTVDTSQTASDGVIAITKEGTTVTLTDKDGYPTIDGNGIVTIDCGNIIIDFDPNNGRITITNTDIPNKYDPDRYNYIYINSFSGKVISPDDNGQFPNIPASITFDSGSGRATITDSNGNSITINPDEVDNDSDNYDTVTVDTSQAASNGVIAITKEGETVILTDKDGKPTVASNGTVIIDNGNMIINFDPNNGHITLIDKTTGEHLYINDSGKAIRPDSNGRFPNITPTITFNPYDGEATIIDAEGNRITIDPYDVDQHNDYYDTVTVDTSRATSDGVIAITKGGETVTLTDKDGTPGVKADGTVIIDSGNIIIGFDPNNGRTTIADTDTGEHLYINDSGKAIRPDSSGQFPNITPTITFNSDNIATVTDADGNSITIDPDDLDDATDTYDAIAIDTSRAASDGVITITKDGTKVILADKDGYPTVAHDGTVTIDNGNISISIAPNGCTTIADKNSNEHIYINSETKVIQPDSKGQYPASITFDADNHSATIYDNSDNYINLDPDDANNDADTYDTVSVDTSQVSMGIITITKGDSTVTIRDADGSATREADGSYTIDNRNILINDNKDNGLITITDKNSGEYLYINDTGKVVEPDSHGQYPASITFDTDHNATLYDNSGTSISLNPDDFNNPQDDYDIVDVDWSDMYGGSITISCNRKEVTFKDTDGTATEEADGSYTIDDGNILFNYSRKNDRLTITDKNTSEHLYINGAGRVVQPDSNGNYPTVTSSVTFDSDHTAHIIDEEGNNIDINPDDVENPTDKYDTVTVNTDNAENGIVTITKGNKSVRLIDDDGVVDIKKNGDMIIQDGGITVRISVRDVVKISSTEDPDSISQCIYIASTGKAIQPDSEGNYPYISDEQIYSDIVDEVSFLKTNYMNVWTDLADEQTKFIASVNEFKAELPDDVDNGNDNGKDHDNSAKIYMARDAIKTSVNEIITQYSKPNRDNATAIHCDTLDQVYYWVDQLDKTDEITVQPADGSHPITKITVTGNTLELDGEYTLYVYVDTAPLSNIWTATDDIEYDPNQNKNGTTQQVDEKAYQQWQNAVDSAFTAIDNNAQSISEKLSQANTTYNNLCKIITGTIDTILQTQLEYFK